ncbi:hypothetical protein LCGC14_2370150, partial [marine sediment metagenome]
SNLAIQYGLWEALPEAVSNLGFALILTRPLTRIVGRSIATRIIGKLGLLYGAEFLTETITQKGQSGVEVEAGLREERISWVEAFKEIAPQTFLLTTVLGGLGQIGVSSVNRIKKSLKKEAGDSPAFDAINENITDDVFAEVEAESVRIEEEGVVPKVEAPRMTRQERELIESDLFDLKRKLQTAPVEEQAAIQRRIDILESDLTRGEALIGVTPEVVPPVVPKAVPEVKPTVDEALKAFEQERLTKQANFKYGIDITKATEAEYVRAGLASHRESLKGTGFPLNIKEQTQILKEEYAKLPPAVEKPAVEEVPPERVIYTEDGTPINPEEPIPQGVGDTIPVIQDIGAKERVRPTRKVFEKMGLYRLYKGIQRAEVEVGEARQSFAKRLKEVNKLVDKNRRHLVFRELETPGSQAGLTFNEKRAVAFFRESFDKWADTLNLPQSKRIKNYITHIFEADITEQLKAEQPLDISIARALEYRTAKTIFNPFLQERLGARAGLIEDPFAAASAYESRELKVLYYEPLLEKIASIANDENTPTAVRGYLRDF